MYFCVVNFCRICSKHEEEEDAEWSRCVYPESEGEYFHDALERKESRQSRVQVVQRHLVSLRLFVILILGERMDAFNRERQPPPVANLIKPLHS